VAATISRFGSWTSGEQRRSQSLYYGRVIDIDLPRFDKTVEVNLRGPLVWIQEAWRQAMSEQRRRGRQNISSVER